MGGSAFLIHGDFDVEQAAATAPAASVFQRLLGRKAPSLSSTTFPNGASLLQYPADAIQPLARDYLAFIRDRLTKPSPASEVVIDFLKYGPPTIYLRADRAPSETTGPWYVQLSFSGAAGMAETSARVAAHWAAAWYAARGDAVRATILAPAGFSAASAAPLAEAAFVPTREHGYAEREEGALAIDASFLESHPDSETLIQDLDREYGGLLARGVCLCEMCQRT